MRRSVRRSCTTLVAVAAAAASCAGCLYLPLSEKKVLSGSRVNEEQQQAIHIGLTTRAQVLGALGPPDIEWENERIFVYRWEMRQGLMLYAIGAGYQGTAGIDEVPKGYLLLVQFDEGDRVRRLEQLPDHVLESFGKQVRQWAEAAEDGGSAR